MTHKERLIAAERAAGDQLWASLRENCISNGLDRAAEISLGLAEALRAVQRKEITTRQVFAIMQDGVAELSLALAAAAMHRICIDLLEEEKENP